MFTKGVEQEGPLKMTQKFYIKFNSEEKVYGDRVSMVSSSGSLCRYSEVEVVVNKERTHSRRHEPFGF